MKTADAWPAFERHITFERGLSPLSIRDTRQLLPPFLAWCSDHGIDDLHDLTSEHIGEWSLDVAQRLTEVMMARAAERVRTFCKWLVTEGVWPESPAQYLATVLPNRVPPNIPSPWEVARFMEAMPETDGGRFWRAVFELLYSTGARISELQTARIADLDLRQRTLRVRGKGAKDRTTVFGDEAVKAVMFYVEHLRPARQLLADADAANLLFLTAEGKAFGSNGAAKCCQIYAKKAAIKRHIHPHIFRHACATHMLAGGANIREVQVMLGHSKIETTAFYTHASREQLIGVHRACHPSNQKKLLTDEDPVYVTALKLAKEALAERHREEVDQMYLKEFGSPHGRTIPWLREHRPSFLRRLREVRLRQRTKDIPQEARRACTIEDERPVEVAG